MTGIDTDIGAEIGADTDIKIGADTLMDGEEDSRLDGRTVFDCCRISARDCGGV